MNPNGSRVALSVVIIGRNEGSRLVRCLRSVQAIRGVRGTIEIIYVDSDSKDGSAERARALGAQVIMVHPQRPSAALGRNAGWRAAQAPVILFLDGDTILDPDFVASALPLLKDSNVAVVWGHRRELHPEASIYNRVLDLDWVYPPGPSEFCGGDALMRRAALDEVNGFDESLIAGEEPELCRRLRTLGYRIEHIDQPMTLHDLAITRWEQYWRRAERAGHAYAEVAARFRNSDYPLWSAEARRNWIHASILILAIPGGIAAAVVLESLWPLLLPIVFYLALIVRTARRVEWKEPSPLTRLLYGVHSHLQQIPILFGQIGFYLDRRAGRRRRLIEYK
ncbi:glycosyltransferase [Thiocapsa bogorovii]|uniref:glycosyltransferase n=1 Tax=Thiocapsa bogorovii TaxID=521689 RepID=UPI001E54AEE4|nr:glycosyltransferase [Thiocapsa bogorovii]UHD18702.1 glycosyltransferase [Thiocapsa bogorovii]